jgi:hypothetical protein
MVVFVHFSIHFLSEHEQHFGQVCASLQGEIEQTKSDIVQRRAEIDRAALYRSMGYTNLSSYT